MKQLEIKSAKTGQTLTVPEKQFESIYQYKDFKVVREIADDPAAGTNAPPPMKTVPGKTVTTASRTVPVKPQTANTAKDEISAEQIAAELGLTDPAPNTASQGVAKGENVQTVAKDPKDGPSGAKTRAADKSKNAGKSKSK
jgi:hypothetical protein